MTPNKRHEWRTVTVRQQNEYCDSSLPDVCEALYMIEGEGWEIVSVYTRYKSAVILCRKPFVAAAMRTED